MKRLAYVLPALAAIAAAALIRQGTLPTDAPGAETAHATSAFPDPWQDDARSPCWIPLADAVPWHAAQQGPALLVRGYVPPAPPPQDLSDPWEPGPVAEDEDPWIGAVDAGAQVVRAPRPTRGVERWVLSAAAGKRSEHCDLEENESDLPPLVTYDLSALVPRAAHPLKPLLGLLEPDPEEVASVGLVGIQPIATPHGWWTLLAQAIYEAVGPSNWLEDHHLLAWDDATGRLLLVRQDEVGLKRLEDVLDQFAAHAEIVVPLRAEIREAGADPVVFTLDVPWRRAVRACRGVAATYVADFDVECTNECFVTDPILMRLETGVGVAAVRLDSEKGLGDELHVAIARAPGAPAFSKFRPPGWGGLTLPDAIEIPTTACEAWRGRLPATPGVHVLELADGASCRISVGPSRRGMGQPARAWRRLGVPVIADSTYWACLKGSRSGFAGAGPFSVEGRAALLRPARSSTNTLATLRAGLAVDEDEPLHGGIRLTTRSVGSAGCPLALDILLEAGRRTGATRDVNLQHSERAAVLLRLPQAHLDVMSRRVFLSAAGTGAVAFDADLGQGLERCTLELRRLPAR